MRLIVSTCFAFLCLCVPVKAQGTMTPNAAEGAGLIINDSDGALPKGLWRNNPRSEITYLLKNLPDEAPFKSMQQIKRNMLISTYDTGDIINDISIDVGDDLLTLRLQKLLELGLWDDAYALYTKTTNDPGQNSELAQVGIFLSLYKNGIANACLDQKAFGSRFNSIFWAQISAICKAELYNQDNITQLDFPISSVLQNIYTKDDYTISANNLTSLSLLELIMAQIKGKIDYSNYLLSPNTSPRIIRVFLNDARFPLNQKASLESLAIEKVVLVKNEIKLQEIEENDNYDNQLSNNIQLDENNSPFITIAKYVEKNDVIPQNLISILEKQVSDQPHNIFYIQLLDKLSLANTSLNFSDQQITQSAQSFPVKFSKEVKILKSWLDNTTEFSNNPDKVYEKQISLASNGELLPPKGDWTEWLGKTTSNQLAGLSLLIVLNNNKNIGVRSEKLLNDLHHVGLIEQSHQIARDMTARLMRITN